MAKRKRGQETTSATTTEPVKKRIVETTKNTSQSSPSSVSLQIITGSYDRVLHGIIATIPLGGSSRETSANTKAKAAPKSSKVHFQDNFMFNAHASAIRCLAVSPSSGEGDGGKVMLATGGTDERINLYSVSTTLPDGPSLPTLSSVPSLENPKNKELGALMHHTSTVNVLCFPTKKKLLSASDDNSIAATRTTDWITLDKKTAPRPKTPGRPSGDTAPLGGSPSGITHFAVHPSQKLMISVGKGEKCMRLWNLITFKKASVLSFERDLLQSVGEGKWSKGEGQKVVWNGSGDEFAIAFEKGIAVFSVNCEVKCIAVPQPVTKIHQIAYLTLGTGEDIKELLSVSTEDGRILFFDTTTEPTNVTSDSSDKISTAPIKAVLGGKGSGVVGRIKDFSIISPTSTPGIKYIATAGSDGAVMIWQLKDEALLSDCKKIKSKTNGTKDGHTNGQTVSKTEPQIAQVGELLGQYDTNNRITCLEAFQLRGSPSAEDTEEDDLVEDDASDASEADDFGGFD